jgi:hypothetical protein
MQNPHFSKQILKFISNQWWENVAIIQCNDVVHSNWKIDN